MVPRPTRIRQRSTRQHNRPNRSDHQFPRCARSDNGNRLGSEKSRPSRFAGPPIRPERPNHHAGPRGSQPSRFGGPPMGPTGQRPHAGLRRSRPARLGAYPMRKNGSRQNAPERRSRRGRTDGAPAGASRPTGDRSTQRTGMVSRPRSPNAVRRPDRRGVAPAREAPEAVHQRTPPPPKRPEPDRRWSPCAARAATAFRPPEIAPSEPAARSGPPHRPKPDSKRGPPLQPPPPPDPRGHTRRRPTAYPAAHERPKPDHQRRDHPRPTSAPNRQATPLSPGPAAPTIRPPHPLRPPDDPSGGVGWRNPRHGPVDHPPYRPLQTGRRRLRRDAPAQCSGWTHRTCTPPTAAGRWSTRPVPRGPSANAPAAPTTPPLEPPNPARTDAIGHTDGSTPWRPTQSAAWAVRSAGDRSDRPYRLFHVAGNEAIGHRWDAAMKLKARSATLAVQPRGERSDRPPLRFDAPKTTRSATPAVQPLGDRGDRPARPTPPRTSGQKTGVRQ